MAHFAYLAVSVGAVFALFLVFLLAVCLDDALLGMLVLVVFTAFASLWWILNRPQHDPMLDG
jgi:hypothetical protein